MFFICNGIYRGQGGRIAIEIITWFQILIDGRNGKAVDAYGNRLPTLVYLSREKKPGKPHNFKAGSMNALVIKAVGHLFVENHSSNSFSRRNAS